MSVSASESNPVEQPGAVRLRRLGLQPYDDVWRAMRAFTEGRTEATGDELWTVEHPPVFTLGQAGDPAHILTPGSIPVVSCDRGGQVTYHGPGQLVVYTLVDLRRVGLGVKKFIHLLEQAVIDVLTEAGVSGERREKAPGVYVDGRKISALGLRVRGGCCYHGVALNVDMDLTPFTWIHPCGFEELEVTQLRDHAASWDRLEVEKRLVSRIEAALQR